MKYTNSPLVDYTEISPNKTPNRNHKIDTITIHCVVGQCAIETLGNLFAQPSADCSSNYGIGYDGKIGLFVEEKDRSWCSSNAANDHRAITIEVASDTTHPYAVTEKAMNALIDLLVDVCKRNGIKKLLWKADKKLIGQVDKQNMTVHRWFANKACPGEYLYSRHGKIAEAVNKRLGIKPDVKPTPEVKPAPNNTNFKEGQEISLKPNAIYINGTDVPDWVIKSTLYIRSPRRSDGSYILSTQKTGAITGVVSEKYIKATSQASSEPRIGDIIKLKANAKYTTGDDIPNWVINSTLYLREIDENSYIFSTQKTGAITGRVEKKYVITPNNKFKPYVIRVTAKVLNVRVGAGTQYPVSIQIKENECYTIIDEKDGWGKLKSGAGWISLDYTETID